MDFALTSLEPRTAFKDKLKAMKIAEKSLK
jgi:hypothetical protein